MNNIRNFKKFFSGKTRHKRVDNINDANKFIFVHIPKNAGTSVYRALGMEESVHYTIHEYQQILGSSYSKYFTFCFVRNPFGRFVSLYNYARMEESYYHNSINPEKAKFGKHQDYDLLKNASLDEAVDYLVEGKLKSWDGGKQWLPQYKWILNTNNKISVDYIGRTENIFFDFRNLSKMLKMDIHPPLNHLNKSTDAQISYKKIISPQARKKLEEYYKKDFELFGYSFDFDNKYFI
ncbi:hypothetical protein BH10BAC2_BH10BAC2_16430 [soil metagenome]